MKKISILSLSILLIVLTTFLVASKIQAQSVNKPRPKNSLTIAYNKDKTIKRIDAVFTNKLTLDSLISIAETLKKNKIVLTYRNLKFDNNGLLTGISCDVNENHAAPSGSFSIDYLDSTNKNKAMGFYYDYSKNAKSAFCTGSCW